MTNRVRIALKRSIQSMSRQPPKIDQYRSLPDRLEHSRASTVAKDYRPLGVEGGIARSLQNMRALSDLLAARNIPLTIVVYPWAQQLAQGDRNSPQFRKLAQHLL